MEPSRLKRQRLMVSSSSYYVSPPRPDPDVPARFESLNDDTLGLILKFVGRRSYRSFGGVNKHCKEIYITSGMAKETFVYGYGSVSMIKEKVIVKNKRAMHVVYYTLFKSVGKGIVYYNRKDVFEWAIQEKDVYVLGGICNVAAGEGRIDLLNEVWSNVNFDDDVEDKEDIFYDVDENASRHGKLEVLKWLDIKGLFIYKEGCALEAASGGQLNILKWLREEKGLKFDVVLYKRAVGHLHVLKWLREREIPWYKYTFMRAVGEGNSEVLQWLHEEGCPWESTNRINQAELKPEVVYWCRVNGYGDRLF